MRGLWVIVALFVALPASAQERTMPSETTTLESMRGVTKAESTFITLNPNPTLSIKVGKIYVTIKPDGAIVYGEGYTPDAAADAFWQAIGRRKPDKECVTP